MSEDESEEDRRSERGSNLSRRELVASGAVTWATISLAGCTYLTGPDRTESEDEGTTADGEQTAADGEQTTTGNETTPSDGDGTTTVTNETTTTTSGSGGGSCASIRRFSAGMEIAMNVDVFDRSSGEHLGAETVDDVRVEFPDADFEPVELDWSGPHEEFTDEQWGGKLSTTDDVESGTYRYEIVVEGGVDGEERITDQFTIV